MLHACRWKPTSAPVRKTELAHRALATHGSSLDLRQRRALIRCDGQRTAVELTRMLGADTPALLLQLQTLGHLNALDAVASTSAPQPANDAGTPASTPATARRRCLSAARVRERVADVLPEPQLPALAALVLEDDADAVA